MRNPILTFFLAFILTAAAHAATPAQKLNVVLILADDLGWTDLACFGSDLHETPALDQLARDGMTFTQNYSACTVCSPTRSALLTGKYPARLHVTDWIPGHRPDNPKLLVPDWTKYLPLEETTLAEVFKAAGYATATIGKWHLGDEEHYPEKQGFDLNVAGTHNGAIRTFFAPWNISTLTPEGNAGDYITDRLSEEAAQFIERAKDRPFFLYLPHYAVHTPIQGRADLVAKYEKKIRAGLNHANATYAAMTESLDMAIGRLRQKLAELKLADRTIIVFTSDNGGRFPTTSNVPLRSGKGSAYEGGVRVPLIVYWPGVTKPGSVSDAPVITMDLFPTIVEMAGVPLGGAKPLDGVSITSLLRGGTKPARDTLYWHYPHHHNNQHLGGPTPYGAIRSGDFKLVEFFNDMHVELYNIRADIGEKIDLAVSQPGKVEELSTRLHAWRKEVGAQMPRPNPNYDPRRPEYTRPPPKAPKKAGG
ncbi:MAG: sulfatase [Opitutaceae bacterium]